MKVFSDDDFEKFPVDSIRGHIKCPQGDYSRVKTVPARCVFRNSVTFGKGVHIGKGCSFRHSVCIGRHGTISDYCEFKEVVDLKGYGRVGRGVNFHKELRVGPHCSFESGCDIKKLRCKSKDTPRFESYCFIGIPGCSSGTEWRVRRGRPIMFSKYSNTVPETVFFNTVFHGVVALAFNGNNGRLRNLLKQTKLSGKQIKYRTRVVESVANRWPDATRL